MIFDAGFYAEGGWTNETMGIVLDESRQLKWATEAFENYKRRFDPVLLFERSGFWSALEKYYGKVANLG